MRIYWIVSTLILISITNVVSQTFTVFGTDVSQFPKVKAKCVTISSQGTIVKPQLGDIRITENEIPRAVTDIRCSGGLEERSISAVIMADVSSSVSWGKQGETHLDIIKAAIKKCISGLNNKSECAIAAFDSKSYIYSDFSKDKTKLVQSAESIVAGGHGADYSEAFLSSSAGGLYISQKARNNRVMIMITDGNSSSVIQEQIVITQARTLGCAVYCVSLGFAVPQALKNISRQTGGAYFGSITSVKDAEKIVAEILAQEQYANPCEITWTSCFDTGDSVRKTLVKFKNMGLVSEFEYPLDPINRILVSTLPAGTIELKNATPGSTHNINVALRVQGTPLTVTSVKSSNPKFTITPDTFSVAAGSSVNLTVSYTPTDTGYEYSEFTLQSNLCTPIVLYASGGSGNVRTQNPTLRILEPNGGERIPSGGSTLIRWTGIAATDTVLLEFSTNNGKDWNTITDKATGLEYEWKSIPNTAQTKCLIRVSLVSSLGVNTSVTILRHESESVSYGEFSPNQDKALTCSGNAAFIWDVDSGKLLHTLKMISGKSCNQGRYNHAGTIIVTTSVDNTIRFWDAQSGQSIKQLQLPNMSGSYLAEWSVDDRYVAITLFESQIPTVKIFRVSDYTEVFSIDGLTYNYSSINKLGFDNTSSYLITLNDKNILDTWKINGSTKVNSYANVSDFTLDLVNKSLIIGKNDTIEVRDIVSGSRTQTINTGRISNEISISPDATRIASVHNNQSDITQSNIKIINRVTGTVLNTIQTGARFTRATFSSDNSSVTGIYGINAVHTYNTISGFLLNKYGGHQNTVTSISVNNSASKLLTTSYDYTARIWRRDAQPVQRDVSDDVWEITPLKIVVKDILFANNIINTNRDSIIQTVITNNSSVAIPITEVSVTGSNATDFSIVSVQLPFTLQPDSSINVEIRFRPTVLGVRNATLNVYSQSYSTTAQLQGEGISPYLQINNEVVDMGNVKLSEQKDSIQVITIKNISNKPITITSALSVRPNDNDFIVTNSTGSATIQPNEVRSLDVRFKPSAVGRTSGRILITTDTYSIPTAVSLYGQGVYTGPAIEATIPQFISAGCSDTTTDSISISNIGVSDLTISSINIQGTNQSNFTLKNITAPITITPSETKTIVVTFTASTNGAYNAVVAFVNNSTVPVYTVNLSAKKNPIVLNVLTKQVRVDTICPNQEADIPIVIQNSSTENAMVAFQSSNIQAIPTQTIAANKQDTIHIRLAPRTTQGAFSFLISVINTACNTTENIGVFGSVIEPIFTVPNLVMHTLLNTLNTDSLEIRNTSQRNITIKSLPKITPFTFVNSNVPFVVKANSVYKLAIQYTPVSKDSIVAIAEFTVDCGVTQKFTIKSIASGATASIEISSSSAKVGNIISIPVFLRQPVNLEQAGVTSVQGFIRYNASLLEPLNPTPQGTVNGKYRIIPFTFPVANRNPKTDIIATLQFKVLLGDSVLTYLYIDSAKAQNGNATIATSKGIFSVFGLCTQGGTRLFNPFAATQLFLARPHPVTDGTTVEFETSEDGSTTLLLADINGNTIQTLVNEQLKAGTYSYVLTTNGIISGSYWLVLQTATQNSSLRMEVVK